MKSLRDLGRLAHADIEGDDGEVERFSCFVQGFVSHGRYVQAVVIHGDTGEYRVVPVEDLTEANL